MSDNNDYTPSKTTDAGYPAGGKEGGYGPAKDDPANYQNVNNTSPAKADDPGALVKRVDSEVPDDCQPLTNPDDLKSRMEIIKNAIDLAGNSAEPELKINGMVLDFLKSRCAKCKPLVFYDCRFVDKSSGGPGGIGKWAFEKGSILLGKSFGSADVLHETEHVVQFILFSAQLLKPQSACMLRKSKIWMEFHAYRVKFLALGDKNKNLYIDDEGASIFRNSSGLCREVTKQNFDPITWMPTDPEKGKNPAGNPGASTSRLAEYIALKTAITKDRIKLYFDSFRCKC